MTQKSHTSDKPTARNELRLERMLGRRVFARNNQSVGRLEEIRAELQGSEYVVTEYVIGSAGLLERLGIGVKMLVGIMPRSYVARQDQLDISDPEKPRLTCPSDELRRV